MAAFCGWPRTTTGIYTMEPANYELHPQPLLAHPRALGTDFRWVDTDLTVAAWVDPEWLYGSDTEVPEADLRVDNEYGRLWLRPSSTLAWSRGQLDNKVTFTGGLTVVGEDIVVACAFAVKHLLGRNRTGGNNRTAAGETITPVDASMLLPAATKEALGPYIRWSTRVSGGGS